MEYFVGTEEIAGCIVNTYIFKNDDIYDSHINEIMLERKRRSREIDKKCDRFSPTACHTEKLFDNKHTA